MLTTRLAGALLVTAVMLWVPVGPHDWGDDFALYILQAAGFAGAGSPASLFVPNPDTGIDYSPTSYPPGFPVLLAPVYGMFGRNLDAFQIYMSVLLLATGLATYRYASRRLGNGLLSVAVALVVIFHGASLDLKQFVLSDIPFTLFTIWFLDAAEESSEAWLALGLVVIAWLVRSAGIVAMVAWVCDAITRAMLSRDDSAHARTRLRAALIAGAIVVLVWLFMRDAQGYNAALQQANLFATIPDQYAALRDLLAVYLGDMFGFAGRPIVTACLMVLLVVGAWTLWRRDGRTLGLWFCALYVALLLGYPYARGGYRLILPLLPICWTYVARGWLVLMERMPATRLIRPAFAAVLIVLSARQVYEFARRPSPSSVHPASPAAVELYAAMQQAIPAGDLTLSGKPRALALFAERRGITLPPVASDAAVDKLVADWNVQYVISGESLRNIAVMRYCAGHPDRVVFRNDAFAICRTH